MKIEVTGRYCAGLGVPIFIEKIVTIVISYDPASSGEIEVSDQGSGATYTGIIGFAIEKSRAYELILVYYRKKNVREILSRIDRVDKVIRDGEEVPSEEWLSISGGTT